MDSLKSAEQADGGDCSKILGRSVVSGKKPIELRNSWFSAKTILVLRHGDILTC